MLGRGRDIPDLDRRAAPVIAVAVIGILALVVIAYRLAFEIVDFSAP